MAASPDVFNHNLETVPSPYLSVRPGARYFHSIRLCSGSRKSIPTIFTKSGMMVGLGEERHEVLQVMDDLRWADVDFLTIGQYLQPTRKHHAVDALRPARRVRRFREGRLHQGLPDGVGEPADAFVASCGRGLRQTEGGARGAPLALSAVHARFSSKRRVAHRADEMFDLVADVERYPNSCRYARR